MPVRGSARDEKPLRKAIWSAIGAVAVLYACENHPSCDRPVEESGSSSRTVPHFRNTIHGLFFVRSVATRDYAGVTVIPF